MKTPSTTLHKLIHSLNQSEKRYLNLYTQFLQGNTNDDGLAYFELIKEIETQENYDEPELKKKIAGGNDGNFKRLKHYATEAVLRSLENYHANTHSDVIIYRKLMQAEILFQKKQFSLVLKCVEKAEEIAVEGNRINFLLMCAEWRLRIANELRVHKAKLELVSVEQIQKLSAAYCTWMQLVRHKAIVYRILTGDKFPGTEEKKLAENTVIQVKELMGNEENGYSINITGYTTISFCYRMLNDWPNSCIYREKIVKQIELDQNMLPERGVQYIASVGNLMNAYRELDMQKEVENNFNKVLDFYNSLPNKHKNDRAEDSYINVVNSYLLYLYKKGNYAEVLEKGEMVLSGLKRNAFVSNNNMNTLLFRSFTYSAFGLGRYREALKHYNTMLECLKVPQIPYLFFGLVLYYEMGERELLFHKAKSLRYYMDKVKDQSPFFRIMIKAFGSYLGMASEKSEEKEAFEKLKKEMKEKKIEPADIRNIEGFNYHSWIENR